MRRGLLSLFALLLLAPAAQAGRCGDQPCRADVGLSGHAEPQPIRKGEPSEFKFTVHNAGEDGALAIDFQAVIPSGLQIVEVVQSGGRGCTVKGNFVQCDFGDFANQQLGIARVKVRGAKTGTHIAKAKVYASDIADPNGGNNQVSATLMVQAEPGDGSSVRIADPQRVLKTGGVRLRVTPTQTGRMTVRGEVRTTAGRVKLTTVSAEAGAAQERGVFLGTTAAALRKIRAGFKRRSRLRTIIWVRTPGGTVRREIHLRR